MADMDKTMKELLTLLGFSDSEADIDRFIEQNKGVPTGTPLHEAHFWNETQSRILKDETAKDARLAEAVNRLDELLRKGT